MKSHRGLVRAAALLALVAMAPIHALALPAPGNDGLAGAQAVTSASFAVTEDDTGASRELNEPAVTGFNTLWYLWTAPANLNVTVTASGTANSLAVAAFQSGTAAPLDYRELNYIASNNTYNGGATPSIAFKAVAGTTYVLSMGAEYSGSPNGDATLSLTSTPGGAAWIAPPSPTTVSPANDNIANAQVLTGPNLQVVNYDASATTELGEPAETGFNTVWYAWTAPANLNVTVSAASTNGSLVLAAFQSGTAEPFSDGELNYIISANTSEDGATPAVTFKAAAGATYLFSMGAEYSGSPDGSALLTLTSVAGDPAMVGPAAPVTASPVNDDVANAQAVSGSNFEVVGYNTSATTELGEPAATGYNTLWYSWIAPANLKVTLNLAASNNSVALAAFVGGNPEGATYSQLNYIGSNNTLRGGASPSITFAAAAGTTYLFSVGAEYSGLPNGTTLLTMTSEPLNLNGVLYSPPAPVSVVPANDSFANARMLYGATMYALSYNAGATTELGEPAAKPGNNTTVWYKWTMQQTGPVILATVYADFLSYAERLRGQHSP